MSRFHSGGVSFRGALTVALSLCACGPTSRATRVGETVILPRSVHCSIDIHGQRDAVDREHRIVGTVDVWGATASDRTALEQQVQLRACELGADAVINLSARGDDTWSGQAIVWLSETAPPPEPTYVRPPPPPVEPQPPPPPPDPKPPAAEPTETAEEPTKGKGKGKGKKKKKKKRRRRR